MCLVNRDGKIIILLFQDPVINWSQHTWASSQIYTRELTFLRVVQHGLKPFCHPASSIKVYLLYKLPYPRHFLGSWWISFGTFYTMFQFDYNWKLNSLDLYCSPPHMWDVKLVEIPLTNPPRYLQVYMSSAGYKMFLKWKIQWKNVQARKKTL